MKIDIDINKMYDSLMVSIKNNEMNEQVTQLIKKLESDNTKNILGKIDDSIYLLKPEDMICIYSEAGKVKADTMERQYELKDKLYQLEDQLSSMGFVRLSKYAIANVNMIKRIDVEFNGSLVVTFKNGKSEGISRRNVSKVKNYLGL